MGPERGMPIKQEEHVNAVLLYWDFEFYAFRYRWHHASQSMSRWLDWPRWALTAKPLSSRARAKRGIMVNDPRCYFHVHTWDFYHGFYLLTFYGCVLTWFGVCPWFEQLYKVVFMLAVQKKVVFMIAVQKMFFLRIYFFYF